MVGQCSLSIQQRRKVLHEINCPEPRFREETAILPLLIGHSSADTSRNMAQDIFSKHRSMVSPFRVKNQPSNKTLCCRQILSLQKI
mmetsp:Transcript_11865/g.24217  ORF Transcript_11865/g.24217 Transcript_11865/m.24217 type:complete len:86 (-) Transcript_11865:653-910(-)